MVDRGLQALKSMRARLMLSTTTAARPVELLPCVGGPLPCACHLPANLAAGCQHSEAVILNQYVHAPNIAALQACIACRRFFDPKAYRVCLYDQRGCGQSTPRGCLVENNTKHLVSDMELLREHLGVQRWMLCGGSWGVALALAYACKHTDKCALAFLSSARGTFAQHTIRMRTMSAVQPAPSISAHLQPCHALLTPALCRASDAVCLRCRVTGLVLRGMCTMRRSEIDWVFRGGCRKICPAAWDSFVAGLSARELQDPLSAYYARLTAPNTKVRQQAAMRMFRLQASLGVSGANALQVWTGAGWEAVGAEHDATLAQRTLPLTVLQQGNAAEASLLPWFEPANGKFAGFGRAGDGKESAQQLLTAHFSSHNGFFANDGLLDRLHRLRHIPAIAVQGRLDMTCPVETMWDVHKTWPELEVQVVSEAGHSMYDARIRDRVVCALDRMKDLVPPACGYG